jgi:hypothetical protein
MRLGAPRRGPQADTGDEPNGLRSRHSREPQPCKGRALQREAPAANEGRQDERGAGVRGM